MARTIQQVKQELEILENTVAETATQLKNTYDDYLDILGESAKKQLILACYQLCTKIYAESFLKLSFSQRQKLQEQLRALGKEIQPELKKPYKPSKLSKEQADLSLIAEMLKNLPLNKMSKSKDSEEKLDDAQIQAAEIDENLADLIANSAEGIVLENGRAIVIEGSQLISIEKQDQEDNEENENNMTLISETDHAEDRETEELEELEEPTETNFNDPQQLITWQKNIEKQIKKALDDISKKANSILQSQDLIPKKLPTKILEIALKNADSGSRMNKVKNIPNVMSLVIEVDKGKKSKSNTSFNNVNLLRLKLTEIEFADPNLSNKRNEIRNLLKKISQIQNDYQETKHEQAMAEADAAWRSSWYED